MKVIVLEENNLSTAKGIEALFKKQIQKQTISDKSRVKHKRVKLQFQQYLTELLYKIFQTIISIYLIR